MIPLQDMEKVATTLEKVTKGCEEKVIAGKQHSVLRCRDSRKTASNVQCHGRLVEQTNATTPRGTRTSRAWKEFPGASRGATRVSRTLQTESAGSHGVDQHHRKGTHVVDDALVGFMNDKIFCRHTRPM